MAGHKTFFSRKGPLGLLIAVVLLTGFSGVHASTCKDALAEATATHKSFLEKYASWYKVEVNSMGYPRNSREYGALEGKQVAVFLRDSFNFDKEEEIKGKLIQPPIPRGESDSSYHIQLSDGTIKKIGNTYAIKELRVYLESSTATQESFLGKYANWHKVEVNSMGLPRNPMDYEILDGKQVALFLEDIFDFNKREEVEGRLLNAPRWEWGGNGGLSTYDIQLSDGTIRKISDTYAVKELRVLITP